MSFTSSIAMSSTLRYRSHNVVIYTVLFYVYASSCVIVYTAFSVRQRYHLQFAMRYTALLSRLRCHTTLSFALRYRSVSVVICARALLDYRSLQQRVGSRTT